MLTAVSSPVLFASLRERGLGDDGLEALMIPISACSLWLSLSVVLEKVWWVRESLKTARDT